LKNIFNQFQYNNNFNIDDWNALTKDVFFKYFNNENIYLNNIELLQTELVNYLKLYSNENYISLLDKIYQSFIDKINVQQKSFKVLFDNLKSISDTDDKYMSYFISQPDVSNYTKKDFAIYYFRTMDEIIEGCYKPRFNLFYKFSTDKLLDTKTFGDLVNDKELTNFELLVKDPIVGIYINQWRNISSHKDFEISKDTIKVTYGTKRDKFKNISHDELKQITFWVRDIYGVLRLAETLIYLNYMKNIMDSIENKKIDINMRTESSLVHIIHNLQLVGFQFESYVEDGKIFELNLYVKNNNDIQESIIHASQIFSLIACALNDDEFQKDKFSDIKINILNLKKEILACASIDINSCLDFSNHKLNIEKLISRINFDLKTVEVGNE